MNKTEAAQHLVRLGYNAESIDGLVQIIVDKPLQQGEIQRLEKHLYDIGYRSSWGWKVVTAP